MWILQIPLYKKETVVYSLCDIHKLYLCILYTQNTEEKYLCTFFFFAKITSIFLPRLKGCYTVLEDQFE